MVMRAGRKGKIKREKGKGEKRMEGMRELLMVDSKW